MPDIESSLARLTAFAASWNEGDLIDDSSGLTTEDLERLIEWMRAAQAGPS